MAYAEEFPCVSYSIRRVPGSISGPEHGLGSSFTRVLVIDQTV